MYTSLHGHTESSNIRLLDSISKPHHVIDRAHELGLKGVAITDHEALSSFIKAEQYLSKKKQENPDDSIWQNMKFIRGNEIYLVRNGLNKENYVRGEDRFFHFILLAKDFEGYLQLCELSSRAWKRAYKHFQIRVPTYYQDLIDVIGANQGHIIGSTACIGGQIGNKLLQAKEFIISQDEAMTYCRAWLARMQEILGEDNLYLEMQPGISKDQIYCNNKILELSRETNIPYIITTDHHYTKREDRKIHKAYLNSKNGEREVDDFYEATYMMSAEEIHERMDEHIGAAQVDIGLQNTNKICDRIEEYSLQKNLEIPYLPQKRFDVQAPSLENIQKFCSKIPKAEPYLNGESAANKQMIYRLVNFMMGDDGDGKPHWDFEDKCNRMNTELGIIWDAGLKLKVDWSKYFLQVADYLNIYWTDGDSIICPSRGSAGASYVCFALGIIQIDPTREGAPLIFERFMNPDRASVLD